MMQCMKECTRNYDIFVHWNTTQHKKNQVVIYATTQINHTEIILSQRSQTIVPVAKFYLKEAQE
jgi:hypothetical protein